MQDTNGTKQLRQTTEKIQLHSWWITVATWHNTMAKIKYFELYYFFEFLCSVASGVRNFKSKWKILTSKFCTGSPQWNGKSKNGDTVWFVFLAAVIFKKIRIKQCKIPKNTFWKWLWPKKSDPSSARCNMARFKDDCGQKTEPNSVRYKMAPFQNNCGQKFRSKQCKI